MQEYVYKGQVYPTINQLSQATTVYPEALKKMLAPFSETEGRIDVTQLIDDYLNKRNNKRNKEYVYKGQVYPTIKQLSQATNIALSSLCRMLAPFSETEGRIDVTQLIDDYWGKRDKEYV